MNAYRIIFTFAVLHGLLFISIHNTSATDLTLKIGAIYGLSGNTAQYGTWAKRGSEVAIEEINAHGGVGGRPLAIIYEDSMGQPTKAVAAYQKLRTINRVGFVSTFLSSVALAIKPLAN